MAERRFFVELDKLAYTDILAIPVVFGRGMALSIIGLNEELSNRARHSIVDAIGHFAAALLLRSDTWVLTRSAQSRDSAVSA